jgi:all-trans-retinol dehydrogenase (NAD+)
VCPSYIDTGLFAGARPARFTWMLTADSVASAVVQAIRRGKETVVLPWTVGLIFAVKRFLPQSLFHGLCRWMGVNTSLTEWTGHG